MNVLKFKEKYTDYVIQKRREFHMYPEVSMEEHQTARRIREELDGMGIPYRICGGITGTLATIEGKKPGRTILLRADMDALSLKEENKVDFTSKNPGVMHACGHDGHTAMLLAAAGMLKDMQNELAGRVILAFQPAEEIARGAIAMINDGALTDVDGCFAIHLWNDIDAGKVSIEPGPRMASGAMFEITVKGKGGHGAVPHTAIDAGVTAAAIVMNMQTIVSREINPLDVGVVTVGRIETGVRWNIIPDSAIISGTTRGFNTDICNSFSDMINRIASQTAAAFRAEATLSKYLYLAPPTINDAQFTAGAALSAEKIFSMEGLHHFEKIMGGEDFSEFLVRCPGALAFIGTRNEACGANYPHHSSHFNIDETALINGAMLYAQVAMDFTDKM